MNIQNLFDCLWKDKRFIAFLVASAVIFCAIALNFVHSTTAKVIVKFLGEDAENGLTENGMKIDPYEMCSALVIKNAAMTLGYEDVNIEPIRRNMTIIPITSTAEKEKYASWIENFSDYDKTEEDKKTPIYYSVSLKTTENTDYARNMLYSIIHQYRDYYTKKYTYRFDVTNLENDIQNQYDYYETIDIIKNKIESNIDYLNNLKSSDFDYRSYKSGYSINDLIEKYKMLNETELALAEQTVLENKLSKNYYVLISNLENKLTTTEQNISLYDEKAKTAKELMQTYAKKNKEYLWNRFDSDENQSNQVREDVERDDEYLQIQSTYDQLMSDYVKYRTEYENYVITKTKYENVIDSFKEGIEQNIPNSDIEITLLSIYEKFNQISNITKEVIGEYNTYRESKSLIAVSGVIVESSANSIFYYTVCIVMALALGVLISISKELYFVHKNSNNTELTE